MSTKEAGRKLSVSFQPPPQPLGRPAVSAEQWLSSKLDELLRPRRVSERQRLLLLVLLPAACFLFIAALRHTAIVPPAIVTSSEVFEALS